MSAIHVSLQWISKPPDLVMWYFVSVRFHSNTWIIKYTSVYYPSLPIGTNGYSTCHVPCFSLPPPSSWISLGTGLRVASQVWQTLPEYKPHQCIENIYIKSLSIDNISWQSKCARCYPTIDKQQNLTGKQN